MTITQMVQALDSIGACFAVTTAKTVLANDPYMAKSSYHIHPDKTNPQDSDIVRLYSQAQLADYVKTAKAARRATNDESYKLWILYEDRWSR